MLLMRSSQRGDTIIEVMLAVAIFSAVAIGGLTIMNQGMAAAQRSLELTLVRHEIDSQAEALRAMHSEAIAQKNLDAESSTVADSWQEILSNRRIAPGELVSMQQAVASDGVSCQHPSDVSKLFVVNPRNLTVRPGAPASADTYSQIRYLGEDGSAIQKVDGLWIQAVRGVVPSGTNAPGYTDFYIRACWSPVGQSRPATISSVVRLYEP